MTCFHNPELTHGQGVMLGYFIEGYRSRFLRERKREATDADIKEAVHEFVYTMLMQPRGKRRGRWVYVENVVDIEADTNTLDCGDVITPWQV